MTLARDLTLKQIRAFAAVIRLGSVTKAAEELCVTPPAISSQIKTLKALVGAEILKRDADGLRPSQAGKELLTLFERIDASVSSSAQKIDAIKAGRSGALGVGVVSTGKYYAPYIFAAFMQAYPDINLHPLIGNRQAVLKALQNRTVDLVIMGRPPAQLDVVAHVLGDHPNIMIAAPDHPLAKVKKITASELLQETILLRELGSGTRMLLRRFMERIGKGVRYPEMTIGSNESIKQAVMAGLGVAMISKHTCLAELESGRLVALDIAGLPIVRKWILVHLKEQNLSGAAKSFHAFLLENRERFIPGYN